MFDDMNFINVIAAIMFQKMLDAFNSKMALACVARWANESERFTAEYMEELAITLYLAIISVPDFMLDVARTMPVLEFARGLHDLSPHKYTRAALYTKMTGGFGAISPAFASSLSEEMLVDTAKFLLYEYAVLRDGWPTIEDMKTDSHIYFDMSMTFHDAQPDREQATREAAPLFKEMSEDEIAEFPPELQKVIRDLRNI